MRKNTRFDREPNAKCEYCGKSFFRYEAELNRVRSKNTKIKRNFCNLKCFGKWNAENVYNIPNTICDYCGKHFHRSPSLKDAYSIHFCDNACQGKYWQKHMVGENASNWQGGLTEQRKYELQSTKYRKWRAKLLKNAICILCSSEFALELHHVESRKDNPLRIRDESNVVPICEECHDLFHSVSRKGSELRERLNAILAQ